MSQKEKENTAYHESGHAIIGGLLPNADPVHKVTIIPRGMALGITWSLPDEDRHSQHEKRTARADHDVAGRAARRRDQVRRRHDRRQQRLRKGDRARAADGHAVRHERSSARFSTGAARIRCSWAATSATTATTPKRSRARSTREVRKIIETCYANGRKMLLERTGRRSSAWSRRCSSTKRSMRKRCARSSSDRRYDRAAASGRADSARRRRRPTNRKRPEKPKRPAADDLARTGIGVKRLALAVAGASLAAAFRRASLPPPSRARPQRASRIAARRHRTCFGRDRHGCAAR